MPFYVIPAPSITSIYPASGPAGTQVTITGSGFGWNQGICTLTFNGTAAGTASSWTDTSITVNVPTGATTGNVVVSMFGAPSNTVVFAVIPVTSIATVSPTSGVAGTQVAISGSNFGTVQGSGALLLGSTTGTVVTWSDTQILAAVASNARSGSVRVQQNGYWSNSVPFTVSTATISSVSPTTGTPGITQVTIAGSGFGAAQGSGQVWLGTANGVVQSWSDTQIVATVAAGAFSGNAQVLQNGVTSNAIPFTVDALQIASVSPTSGAAGTSVTFTGSGFSASQGSGVVWLGSTAASSIVSWSDTQVIATVAPMALTGVAKIQQNGVWSNAVGFTVPVGAGNTLVPALLNMVVGDTRTLQALNAEGQSIPGLTWATTDPTIVSLSTDDPPLLTALAAGNVTITAGTASTDVTVSAATLPLGTVIWSNPGDGSGVTSIVPAVPRTSGVPTHRPSTSALQSVGSACRLWRARIR
ncbi:MAG: IPT/TIG domain-containing protein [Bryobacteraceae bacterium]